MLDATSHPALVSLVAALDRELGTGGAYEVLVAIALEEAAEGEPAADPVYWLWRSGWRYLAHLRPHAFAVNPTRVRPHQPLELAFLYGLRREPQAVHPLELTVEQTELVRRGRTLLHTWTGLPSYVRPCFNYVIADASRAGAGFTLERYANVCALCMDPFVGLRRRNAFRRRALDRWLEQGGNVRLAAGVLHEETHVAVNTAAGRRRGASGPLVRALEEAAALVAEEAVGAALCNAPYRSPALCDVREPLSMIAGQPAAAVASMLIAAAAESARTGEDRTAATILNRVSGRRWAMSTWQGVLTRAAANAR